MGVRGLLKFLRTNPTARVKHKSLAGLAEEKRRKTGKKAVIVCDFISILCWLLNQFHAAKVTEGTYKQESFLFGGDYMEFSSRFISLMKALRYVCAEPILFVDGPRGSVLEDLNAKMSTYVVNARKRLHYVEKCMQFCKHDRLLAWDPEDFKKWRIYPLLYLHILMALRSEDVEIVHCLGEADSEMAEYARVHPEVCGILSTDTDMVMMRRCTIINCKFFDRDDILGLRKPTFSEKPSDIYCDLITPRSLARALKIEEEDLKIISIICGNDYTKSFNLCEELKLSYPFITSAAEWLLKVKNPMTPSPSRVFFDIPQFKELLSKHTRFYFAVQHTYKAYGEVELFNDMCKHCKVVEKRMRWHPLVQPCPFPMSFLMSPQVLDGIKKGEVTRTLSSIVRCGIFWRVKFVEGQPSDTSCARKFTCTHDLIFSLRKIIYMLLGVEEVCEYGHFTDEPDAAVSYEDFSLSWDGSEYLSRICTTDEFSKLLNLIPLMVTAKTVELEEFDDFQCAPIPAGYSPNIASQLKPLVLCSVLLYACSLADESSTFDDPELATDVFLATCLMSVYGNPPFKVLERPTVDAINMNTGFACIIEHAYDMASLFGLLGLLPPPGCIYQPGALIAFHQIAVATEETVRAKSKRFREFVEVHTSYTHIIQLRQFQRLKEMLQDFQRKCIRAPLEPMDLVCVAKAFYHVLGEYHSSLPELEGRIEELQALVTTEPKSPLKGIIINVLVRMCATGFYTVKKPYSTHSI